jgi:two-component system sensor histidine kinase KdpD
VTFRELRRATEVRSDRPEPAPISERVMVCVSSNVDALRVIRNGARIASRRGVEWYAVYVETPRERPHRIHPKDRDALATNIAVAESLGATVVRVKAAQTAEGLIAFARREGITQVVFGQSARSWWELFWRGSPMGKFLTVVRDAAVQVVPSDPRSA